MDGNQLAAQFIRDIDWRALEPDVRRQIKLCLMDALGATLSGTVTRVSRLTARYAARAWRGDESTILLHGLRATAAGSAFANACAANGLDIDDGGKFMKGHPGAQIFPAALAVAEKLRRSGSEMLAAMVAGYEVAFRAGRCWHDHHPVRQACGSWGSLATAAVAARLMRLDQGQIQHALGIAEYHSPNCPMMRDIDNPAMVKHAVGWGAMTGITSAELAAAGFTGIPSILGLPEYREWVADLGEDFHILDGVSFKKLACCAWTHPAIEAAEELVKKHSIAASEIAHIRILTFHEAVRLGTKLPSTTEEAQFNMAWPLAAYLLDGDLGADQVIEERVGDEDVRALASRVEVIESPELSQAARLLGIGDPRGMQACDVEITRCDGSSVRSGVRRSGLNYAQGWGAEQIERKFRRLVRDLDGVRVDELVNIVERFEDLDDVRRLTELVALPSRKAV